MNALSLPIADIIVSENAFNSDDAADIINSNISVINALFADYFHEEELNREALTSYYVDYYLAEMENGGFSQFVFNSKDMNAVAAYVCEGLEKMNAPQHLAYFRKITAILQTFSQERLAAFCDGEYSGENEDRDFLERFDDEFYALNEHENLTERNAAWLRGHPKLRVMNLNDMEALLESYASLIPDYPARKQAALDAEPRYFKLIRRLCAASGLELDHVTAGDPSFVFQGREHVAWYFITDKGLYHFVDTGSHAYLFKGEETKPFFEIPVEPDFDN